MRGIIATLLLVIAWPAAAVAGNCREWRRMDEAQKVAELDGMIEGHLNSNVGRKYTSENRVAMRRCLQGFAGEIREQIDGACAEGLRVEMNALDQIFDRYFLSCVQ